MKQARPRAAKPLKTTTLTARELQVMKLAATGATSQEIANELFLETKTVHFHFLNVYRKLNVKTRLQALLALSAQGVLALSDTTEL